MKPLPNKSRTISLTILILIFIIIAPMLVAYSLGYRFYDIDDVFTLEKTGGVYVHSNISNSQIFLNGDFVKTNGVLLRNTLIQKLRPNMGHKVDVIREGYQSWSKVLSVYPSLVTEARVMMLPTEIESREIFPFLTDEGVGTIVAPTSTPMFNKKPIPNNKEYLDLMTLFEGKDIYATSSTSTAAIKEIPKYFTELGIEDPELLKNLIENSQEVSWLENGDIVLHWVGRLAEIPYYYCLGPDDCRTNITLEWRDNILKFDFMPGRNDVFLVQVKDGLFAVEVDDRSDRNIQYVYTEDIDDFEIGPNGKIVVRQANRFFELTL